ncbi:MAG: hypothetical protein N2053_06810, partial [Chitinispirillaceae bacterium]|nr:hypothetical protein [Chitinispirillaceae bacterium]
MKILVFVFLLIADAISQSEVYDIPSDEVDFIEYNKSLDSLTLARLKELYERQLNVPDGELILLCEVFPELYEILPLDKSSLDRYIPWNEEKIEKFLEDYPVLRSFMPLLRFKYKRDKSNGTLSFFIKRSYCDTITKKWAQFRVNREKLKLVGSFNGWEQDIKWERRLLYVKPENWLTIELGNTIPIEDKGICYGFFPPYSYSNHLENWLYGGTNFWNCLNITSGKDNSSSVFTPKFSYFFHKRTIEKINGGKISLLHRRNFRVSVGTSRLLIDSGLTTKKELFYFPGNLIIKTKNLTSD